MHLALPTRKTSNPPPYRSSRIPLPRRSRLQLLKLLGGVVVVGLALFYLIPSILGGSERIPSGTPPVVIVTVLDQENYGKPYLDMVRENRVEYAKMHGYATFFPNTTSYDLLGSPSSWSRVPASRHALKLWPFSTYVWYLDQNCLIMNPSLTVEDHVMNPKQLEDIMLKEQSVVPPDSVIKTFSHLKGDQIDLVLTQDREGLSQSSFIIRKGEWAKFFLDTWFDPLYRSYNFQKADTHALEHIVQWHPTILSKLAIIPQRIMNAYSAEGRTDAAGVYKDRDFVIRFEGCESGGDRNCEKEAEPFSQQWRTFFRAQR